MVINLPKPNSQFAMKTPTTILAIVPFLLLHVSMADSDPIQDIFLQCLSNLSQPLSPPISAVTYFPNDSSYTPVLHSYIRNLRFSTPETPKPSFIVTPTHVSHIQASILCSKIHTLQVRIRSGGHDYDGLSYISDVPFIIIDMFNLQSITVNMEDESAWVESGATLGEVYYRIAEQSKSPWLPSWGLSHSGSWRTLKWRWVRKYDEETWFISR
ncbi:hypothetical protein M0R45_013804 [Rubus argutus]|uniref:FAD linked oxidase N-terminal domain-containing protein n=1 Tax=Rubus argutus TaxID=59490 RepID=A0AAW1XKR1_RUBAR